MSSNKNMTIAEEFLTKPSQVAPTLFVGLGGAGCRVINRVYRQLVRRADFKERYKQLVKFAYLDTNIHDLEAYREEGDDCFLISDFEKAEYSKLAGGKAYLDADDYFTQWVPDNYRFRSGDTAGAGQIRIESRLGIYYQVKHKDFVARFRKLIEGLKDHSHGHRRLDNTEIRIVLAYSVAGGTGSGAHLPVAYLLRELAEQFGKPLIFGVAALSSVFEEKVGINKDGVFANGYAALKETEYLMKLGAPESKFFPDDGTRAFHYNPSDRSRRTVTAKPFEALWIVDRPESFSVPDVLAAAGDALFLQLFTPVYGVQAGDFDNYTQHQRFLVPHDFEAKNIPGYTSFYGALGAAALVVPDKSLLQYCARRGGLAVIENSFLQGVPPGEAYGRILQNPTPFYEVEGSNGKPVKEFEFPRRPEAERTALRNRLFQKRVRMLAHAEMEADTDTTFYTCVFQHGHGTRLLPREDGGVDIPKSDERALKKTEKWLKTFAGQLSEADEKLKLSMAHFPLNALDPASGVPNPEATWISRLAGEAIEGATAHFNGSLEHWLKSLKDKEESGAEDEPGFLGSLFGAKEESKGLSLAAAHNYISQLEAKAIGEVGRKLDKKEDSTPTGLDWVPGFEWLTGMSFINSPASVSANLVEKRYAVLAILDRVNELIERLNREKKEREKKERESKLASQNGVTAQVRTPEPDSAAESLNAEAIRSKSNDRAEQARKRLQSEVVAQFGDRLNRLQEKLAAYASVFTDLQSQFERFRDVEMAEAEKLRVEGTRETDRFLLDGEALQIESGRRMWDFYYEDQIRTLGALHTASNPSLAKTVAKQVESYVELRLRGEPTPAYALNELNKLINTEIKEALRLKVVGDQRSQVESDRFGLTLHEALDLEVRYRAMYLTSRDKIDKQDSRDEARAVGEVVLASRGIERTEKPKSELYIDYLRDKIKRLLKEKSDLLCYLDEKHLSQGGVRANEILIAAVHKDLNSGLLKDVLNVSLGLKPPKVVTDDVDDRKMVVFYRAILNVPLYVFGRMREMRACYHQFKNMAKRSKVLHIDRNWEDTLPDLDPAVVEEEHRQRRIRDSVLDFATLLSVPLYMIYGAVVASDDGGEESAELVSEQSLPDYGLSAEDCAVCWRPTSTGSTAERVWVLRLPLEERILMRNRDSLSLEEIDRLEPVIGTTLGETVLELQTILHNSPRLYRGFVKVCEMVREGYSPLVIKSLIRLPGAWRKHRESLRQRYGRSPREDQQRVLDDLENVAAKLSSALIQLYEVLDLRQKQETGLRHAAFRVRDSSSMAPEDRARTESNEHEHTAVTQCIALLRDFKDQEESDRSAKVNRGASVLFKPLQDSEVYRSISAGRKPSGTP